MKKFNHLSLLLILIALTGAGCKKAYENVSGSPASSIPAPDETPIASRAVPPLAQNLAKFTDVLKELYKTPKHLQVINAAILAGVYTDESILLKDLLFPTNQKLRKNIKFQTLVRNEGLNLDSTSAAYWRLARAKNDANFISFLNSLNTPNIYSKGVPIDQPSIYMPYSEEFVFGPYTSSKPPVMTLISAAGDSDSATGTVPVYVNGVFNKFINVLVNDNYAALNPTQVIGVNGVSLPAPQLAATFPPGPPIDYPNLPREVKQVYIGHVRINGHQYDKFVSLTGNGGGSEIRFTRSDGYLVFTDGQAQANVFYSGDSRSISRRQIKKKRWNDFSIEWDGDWELANLQQHFAIFEDDNRNSSTFSGSLSTTLPVTSTNPDVTFVGTIGFTLSYKSDDALIKQSLFNRDVFFVLNRIDLEGETYEGWPVRDRNARVSFTLQDRTLY